MAMTEDFTLFFDTDEFAVSASLTPSAGGAASPGAVLFDENGLIIPELDVQTTEPSAICPSSQWPSAAEGDALSIELDTGTRGYVLRSAFPLKDGRLLLLALVLA